MLALFVLPFAVRNDPMTYEWVFYRALNSLGEMTLLGPGSYVTDVEDRIRSKTWATWKTTQEAFGYKIPTQEELSKVELLALEESDLSEVNDRHLSPNKIWQETLSTEMPAFTDAVIKALRGADSPPKAIMLWANCPSVVSAAQQLGLSVVHNELGPLRRPCFKATAYFDIQGVNGRTSSATRWKAFSESDCQVPVLNRARLLQLLRVKRRPPRVAARRYQAGVALQVPTDSNLIAFGNGHTNLDAIFTAKRYFSDVLVRPHPSMPERHDGLGVDWNETADPADFLESIDHLITINSSLALEAMLQGVPTTIMGDSPFAFGSSPPQPLGEVDDCSMTRWLNWIIFGYLIPEEFLFNKHYYQWRLNDNPDEYSIYMNNYEYWTNQESSLT